MEQYIAYKSLYLKQSGGGSKIYVIQHNAEITFNSVMNLLKWMPFLRKNKYGAIIPKEYEKLSHEQDKIDSIDKEKYLEIFKKNIYKKLPTEHVQKLVNDNKTLFDNVFKRFNVISKNWKFKTFKEYSICITLYGTGGMYDEESGSIIIRVNSNGIPNIVRKNVVHTFVHEMVHIGIEKNIVQHIGLSHWEKEFLVDSICNIYFGDLLVGYTIQQPGYAHKSMLDFVNKDSIETNLIEAIKQYISSSKRTQKRMQPKNPKIGAYIVDAS